MAARTCSSRLRSFHAYVRPYVRMCGLFKQRVNNVCFSRRTLHSSSDIIAGLTDRGLIKGVFPAVGASDHLQTHLETSCRCVYCGFDPTADSLHIGNLVSIVLMIHFQRAGYKTIAVLGGATAKIGDPSGKTTERASMQEETIEQNIESIKKCLQNVFKYHKNFLWEGAKEVLSDNEILNNVDWYSEKNIVDFLSTVGRKFRISSMLDKPSVQLRLNSEEGMSFTEFSYQVFQAFDWLHLFNEYNCTIQIGGNDQIGNIEAGHELIRKTERTYAYGVVVPLLATASGEKLGKSSGNSIWLNPDRTSAYEFYQYFLNTPDSEVEKLLCLFTFVSKSEISNTMNEQNKAPEKRVGQKKLAELVTVLVHGRIGLEQAKRWTDAFFSGDPQSLAKLTKVEIHELFKFAKKAEIIYEPGISIVDTVMAAKCFKRTSDAERTIREGGVSLNHCKVTDPHALPIKGLHILKNDISLLRIGKKNYTVIKWIK